MTKKNELESCTIDSPLEDIVFEMNNFPLLPTEAVVRKPATGKRKKSTKKRKRRDRK